MYFKFNQGEGEWEEDEMAECCSMVHEWRAVKLWISKNDNDTDKNYCPRVLMEIHQISFPHLQWIDVEKNNIESIEILSRIHLPLLERLHLGN